MKYVTSILFVLTIATSCVAKADVMTVRQLKELIDEGSAGKAIAVAYVNGTVDGMVGLDFAQQNEGKRYPEFCKFRDARIKGEPLKNPAYRTEELVRAWENSGQSMDVPAADFVLAFLTAQYGCAK